MYIFPAIDLFEGKAVRLLKGDYDKMTVYSDNPSEIAAKFAAEGAEYIHIVDLEGAKYGTTPNINTIKNIIESSSLFAEVGGGIRSMQVIDDYLSIGVKRVILGTAAVNDEAFLLKALEKHGDKIAVGADIKNGYVSVLGWTKESNYSCFEFCEKMQNFGVKTLICTDISKDGAMKGSNNGLYKELSEKFNMQIIASGGVSSIDDVKALAKLKLYGAIIGKAYYMNAISLKEAIEVAK